MSSIYEITERWANLVNALENSDAEEIKDVINDALDEINAELDEKADAYGRIIRNLEAEIAGIKVEEERLYNRRKSREEFIKWLKGNMEAAMIRTGKDKLRTDLFSWSISANPASADLAPEFYEWAQRNDCYLRYREPEIDKKAIVADLKAGKEVPFATLKQTKSLRFK